MMRRSADAAGMLRRGDSRQRQRGDIAHERND
jgi:hypothetical protein